MIRLLLTIVSLLLAVPAAAAPACHDAAGARATAAARHHAPRDLPAAAAHDCIGCIPPGDWIGHRLAERLLPEAPRAVPAPADRRTGLTLKPVPPPPRMA